MTIKTFPTTTIPFHRPWLMKDEIEEVLDTLNSGWLTTGPKAFRFEEDFKNYIGCRNAIGLNSCTAGLHLSLVAMDFEPGSEVITTPMTFPATANVAVHERLRPVFVDIEPGTLNLDSTKIEKKITSRTKAIIPVHFAGHPCEMDSINAIAAKHNLKVIEDAAHGLGGEYKGKKIGSLGNLTSFSFYANKNITTGEGGMLTVNDDELADVFRRLRLHGLSRDAWNRFGSKNGFSNWKLHSSGFKYNLTDINAALGIHQLKKIDEFEKQRKLYVEIYDEAFKGIPEIEVLIRKDYAKSAYHLYIIALRLECLTIDRNEFLNEIHMRGIGVAVHYIPLHLQKFYVEKFKTKPEDCPIATNYSEKILTLPLYPKMSVEDVNYVIESVEDIVKKYRR